MGFLARSPLGGSRLSGFGRRRAAIGPESAPPFVEMLFAEQAPVLPPEPIGFGPQADEAAAPGIDVELSWPAPTNPDIVATAVLQKSALEDSWDELARVEGTSYVVRNLQQFRTYDFAAAGVTRAGSRSPEAEWAKIQIVPALLQAADSEPAAPESFSAAQEEGVVHFAWQTGGDNVTASYELREGSSWDQALPVAIGIRGLRYDWPWRASGTRTFLIRGADKSGRLGPVASFLLRIDPLETHVTGTSWDEAAAGFPGTKDQVEVIDGELRLKRIPSPFGGATGPFGDFEGVPFYAEYWPEGTYETAEVDLGQEEQERFEVDVTAAQTLTLPAKGFGSFPFHSTGLWRDADGKMLPVGRRDFPHFTDLMGRSLLPVAADVWINLRRDGMDAYEGWRPWVPGVYRARWVRFRVRLRSEGLRFVAVRGFAAKHRRLNKKKEGEVVVGNVPFVDVTFPEPFVLAPKIDALVAGYAGDVIVTNVTRTGFRLEPGAAVFFSDPAVFAPTIHWSAKGT